MYNIEEQHIHIQDLVASKFQIKIFCHSQAFENPVNTQTNLVEQMDPEG